METRMNVVKYRISSTKQPRCIFDFEAVIKVLKRGICLFYRKVTYLYQDLRLCQGFSTNDC